jgi:hypothetical protein
VERTIASISGDSEGERNELECISLRWCENLGGIQFNCQISAYTVAT